ncbi:hypothetical protein QYF61_011545 [Mycteria americana]|uniref:Uncharacterized protein n=1 Tax=Mycteria americana TaxID=33587 RepID=A0AAN7MU67_MYCAM|nr:hypothetical protein QYF61_011545 [Mycteria americana]
MDRLLCYQIMLLILASKSLVKKCLHLMHISLAPQASLANKALQIQRNLKSKTPLTPSLLRGSRTKRESRSSWVTWTSRTARPSWIHGTYGPISRHITYKARQTGPCGPTRSPGERWQQGEESHSKLTEVVLITGGARRTRTKGDTCKYCSQEEFPQQSDVDY